MKVEMYVHLKMREWRMDHICVNPFKVILVLNMIDHMEMDICDAYRRHNHEKHHYCTREGERH
jgi:hypothetical protein